MEIEQLERAVKERFERKLRRAESAFVKAKTAKVTRNCKNCGPRVLEGFFFCKISCCGVDAKSASQCFDEKARACSDFALKRSLESIKAQFRRMPLEELALRWPQIGELLWMKQFIEKGMSEDVLPKRD